ncbi:MAG: DNA polymerase III subunit gamma/tau [Firmicutes bacterium]|nr:DNA polymerase III subunit gamma/tau [Bacillota bacterium]
MTHVALYREWRPQRFADMIGQEHVSRTLLNALALQRINHAYLFCGPRGTGKTSTARILAKAVNCLEQQGGEPCDTCASCRAISGGQSLDVLEIDAASNRGIDEIRELREKVRFAPVQGGYRVYIIDEVHMLTSEAFNALLKTLEEPPPHVIFILATTEAHKVPATILSRCQRFDFRRISPEEVDQRLLAVADSMGVKVTEEARGKIVKASEGSLRDALGLLDQCVALAGESIELAEIDLVLGTVAEEFLEEMTGAMVEGDITRLLIMIDKVINEGKEARKLMHDLTDYLRDLLVVSLGETDRMLVGRTRDKLSAQSQRWGTGRLIETVRYLTSMESEMRWALQPRWLLETALIRVAEGGKGSAGVDSKQMEEMAARIAELERRISGMGKVPAETAVKRDRPPVKRDRQEEPLERGGEVREGAAGRKKADYSVSPSDQDAGPGAVSGIELEQVRERWPGFLEAIRKRQVMVHALAREAEPVEMERGVLTLAFKNECRWHCQRLEEDAAKRSLVEEVLGQALGGAVSIRCLVVDELPAREPKAKGGPAVAEDRAGTGEDPLVQAAVELFGSDRVKIKE